MSAGITREGARVFMAELTALARMEAKRADAAYRYKRTADALLASRTAEAEESK